MYNLFLLVILVQLIVKNMLYLEISFCALQLALLLLLSLVVVGLVVVTLFSQARHVAHNMCYIKFIEIIHFIMHSRFRVALISLIYLFLVKLR